MSAQAAGGERPEKSSPRPWVLKVVRAPAVDPPSRGLDWGHRAAALDETDPYVQGCLAVDFRGAGGDSFFGPQATATSDLPEAGPWARGMVQALLEVCDGSRTVEQVAHWVTPEVRDRIARRGLLARRRGRRRHRPPVVGSLLTGFPADGVCEASAVVYLDGRVRALALRMNGADGRWVITAWELG